MKTRLITIAVTAAAIPISFVAAPYPAELILQHVPTVLGLVLLAVITIYANPSRLSFGCLIGFFWLHLIGARWIYSFVPYDHLSEWLTGATLTERFGWQRNHYDRLVHFASGLLGVAPGSELLQRAGGMRPMGAAVTAISLVLSVGAVYEVLEWQIAILFSPAQAQAYNGQQGDIWDPQKDLALAGLGAVIAAGLLLRWSPRRVVRSTGHSAGRH